MPRLSRITIYPVKSLDGQPVDRAVLLPLGALENDRRWALVDQQGDFINGKRTAKIHRLRSQLDLAARRLSLAVDGQMPMSFDLASPGPLSQWLSDFFELPVSVIENSDGGFPDDTDSPGPTVISTATLETVSRWFDLPLDEARRRFRANLEVGDVEPFWEDHLVAPGLGVVRFRVGEAELLGTNPCQRCPVPGRHSITGEATTGFAKLFADQRRKQLPPWAPADRFDHFYRLAVNTRAARGRPSQIAVGDEVAVEGIV